MKVQKGSKIKIKKSSTVEIQNNSIAEIQNSSTVDIQKSSNFTYILIKVTFLKFDYSNSAYYNCTWFPLKLIL